MMTTERMEVKVSEDEEDYRESRLVKRVLIPVLWCLHIGYG